MAPKKPLILGSRVQGGPKFSASTVSRANGTASLRKKHIYIYITPCLLSGCTQQKPLTSSFSFSTFSTSFTSPTPPHPTNQHEPTQVTAISVLLQMLPPSQARGRCFLRVLDLGLALQEIAWSWGWWPHLATANDKTVDDQLGPMGVVDVSGVVKEIVRWPSGPWSQCCECYVSFSLRSNGIGWSVYTFGLPHKWSSIEVQRLQNMNAWR